MSITKKKLGLAAILVTLVTGGVIGVASADGGGADRDARRAEMIKKFDTNGDGKIDDNEKQAMRDAMKAKHEQRQQEMLAKYDANKDGKLDDGERQVMRDDLAAQRFAKLDTDGNGSLSLAEFKAGMKEHGGFGHHGGHRFGRRGFGHSR